MEELGGEEEPVRVRKTFTDTGFTNCHHGTDMRCNSRTENCLHLRRATSKEKKKSWDPTCVSLFSKICLCNVFCLFLSVHNTRTKHCNSGKKVKLEQKAGK
ncbi:hypothetical protein FQA47_001351 [Oryzias melastigma]|uniref:Uncharacterized protein n=1 Tax=Oryzias melastigma TaxID=30732 RepID=A0A834FRV9_ORYME|nr:hypothetical protein FQA47_001351 [Oryzias melastigma]